MTLVNNPWHRSSERVVAFLDLGTNSVRLLLVRIFPNHTFTTLTQQKEVIRLGEGEFTDQLLQPEAENRATIVCSKFADLARSYGAKEIIAVATSAVREAKNQNEFLRRLRHAANIEMHVISRQEEARLTYLGVVSAVHLDEKKAAFIDIGGGSTELIVGDQRQYRFLGSVNVGAVRLGGVFFPSDETGSVSAERYALIQRYVRNASLRTLQQMQKQGWELAFGSSGTIENLTDIAARALHNRVRQRDDSLSFNDLQHVIKMLCQRNLKERRQIPGINPERADIIIPGAAILDVLMHDLDIREIRVMSDRGLREGLLVDYLSRSEHAELFQGMSVRERSVLQLGHACGFDEKHARHIAELVLQMFDSAKKADLHDLGDHERELLEYAGLLHDIGTFLSYDNHHLHSHYLIRNAELLGFDQSEIALMSVAALFHRKGMPKKKSAAYAALDKHSRYCARILSAFLRIAEGLDRSHNGVIIHSKLRSLKKHAILEAEAIGDAQLEQWGVEDRLYVLEDVLDRPVQVKFHKVQPAVSDRRSKPT